MLKKKEHGARERISRKRRIEFSCPFSLSVKTFHPYRCVCFFFKRTKKKKKKGMNRKKCEAMTVIRNLNSRRKYENEKTKQNKIIIKKTKQDGNMASLARFFPSRMKLLFIILFLSFRFFLFRSFFPKKRKKKKKTK